MINVIYNNEAIKFLSKDDISKLKQLSDTSKLKRSRINLHKNYQSKLQDMVICFKKDSYVEPHFFQNKNTVFKIITGSIQIRIFNSNRNFIKKIILNKQNFFLYINKKTIYDVKGIAKYSLVHEFMEGPFRKNFFKCFK